MGSNLSLGFGWVPILVSGFNSQSEVHGFTLAPKSVKNDRVAQVDVANASESASQLRNSKLRETVF